MSSSSSLFMEFGIIDDTIVEKLRDDENVRVRLQVCALDAIASCFHVINYISVRNLALNLR